MTKRWISLAIVMMVGLFIVVGLVWKPSADQADALTKEAVEEAVLEQYPGEVIATTLLDDVYKMQLKTETGLYALKVDSLNGEIISLELLNKNVVSVVENKDIQTKDDTSEENDPTGNLPIEENDSSNGTVETEPSGNSSTTAVVPNANAPIDNNPGVETNKIITIEQATAISTKHVNGTVDDIELRKLSKESYYLVEIDTVDKREVVVQVNAITGIIMSVIWDDKRADDKDGDESKKENDDEM
jgi:uncharacterized membrane protein YkoI